MSLRWGAEDCDVRATEDDEAREVTKAIVFATMPLGINQITDKTVEEFVERARAYQRVAGAFMTHWDGKALTDRPITREDIELRVGLWTNASPITAAAFNKELVRLARKDHRA